MTPEFQRSQIGFGHLPITKKSYKFYLDCTCKVEIQEGVQMVLSGYVSSSDEMIGCTKIDNDGSNIPLNELVSDIEEADLRLIPHIHQAFLKVFNTWL